MAKIIHQRDRCIGCGACASFCPDYWQMSEDGKASLKGGIEKEGGEYELELEEKGCNQEAIDACPVVCIILKEE